MATLALGDRIRELRLHSGLSQGGLGELSCLKERGHIRLIESGQRQNPSGETLVRIARVLGTTVEYLVTGQGHPPCQHDVCRAVGAARKRLRAAQKLEQSAQKTPEQRARRKERRPHAAALKL